VKGGDLFVDSAVSISKATGLPEIFIGATVVSVATTLPEFLVSSTAALKGYTTMSIGNGVGSIICNIGLILGIVNIISPSKVSGRIFRVKGFTMLVYMAILTILSLDKSINRMDSIILLILLFTYVSMNILILKHKRKNQMTKNIEPIDWRKKFIIGCNFFLGISLIIIGSNLLVNNGVLIAKYLRVPESVISLTIIALGTSLPELTAAITSLAKGYTGLSIGNIIGANILNITMVIGGSASIANLRILKQNIVLDFPVAFLLMGILIIPTLQIKKVSRLQGGLLLSVYFGYLILLYSIYLKI